MKMKQTECSETSVYKTQTPGNYPEENIQHTEQGESLKSRTISFSERNLLHGVNVHPETSVYKTQTPGNYPEENIQHTEHDESLKSRTISFSERNLLHGVNVHKYEFS